MGISYCVYKQFLKYKIKIMETTKFLKSRSAGMILFMGLIAWSCTSDQLGLPEIPGLPEQKFIGSDQCAVCHSDIYNSFLTTGHPYILSEANGGNAPDYPYTQLDHLPEGYAWNDISYVIGGYNWKANYIDANGFIITGDDAEWNFETEAAVSFHPSIAPGTKMYDCGRCHTTGWVSVADGGNTDLDGMDGEFFAAGVQCEQCHGMGAIHEYTRSKDDIQVDASSAFCGTCHSRDDNSITAMDGFIHNYQQHTEMVAAGHGALNCVDCHNPHKTNKGGETGGIINDCSACHSDITNGANHRGVADCITCHMPYASKSAVSRTKYQADIMTHIFKINTAADGQMFNEDGTVANGESGVTLDFVCYRCHKDPNGEGGSEDFPSTSKKTMEELSAYATGYHDE